MNKGKSLQNPENYKCAFDLKINEYLQKYQALIEEYIIFSHDNIYIQNVVYYKFVIKRGVETLNHIFNFLLMYTKNLDLTYYHCQKSFYYYVEFIGQMGDDNHSFLQLNSKDASLFVYKKTIFDINNEYRKEFSATNEDLQYLKVIKYFTKIHNELLFYILEEYEYSTEKKINLISDYEHTPYKNIVKILSSQSCLAKEETLEKINIFIELLKVKKDIEIHKFLYIIELFLKKIQKKPITTQFIQTKLLIPNLDNILENFTPLKIVNWLFNTKQIKIS